MSARLILTGKARENRAHRVDVKPQRKRKRRTMSRDESQGVVLTGYHSNADLLPRAGPRAPDRRPSVDPEPTAPRWDKGVCGCQEAVRGVCERMTAVCSCLPGQGALARAAERCLVTLQDQT